MKKEFELEKSLILYNAGKITLWKAARMADISLWKMIEIVKERRLIIQYAEKEFRSDLEA